MEVLSARTILATSDLPAARGFYEYVLGLRVYREYGVHQRVTGVVYFAGGGFVELVEQPGATAGDAVKLWLQVPDVRAEESRLRRLGVTIRQPTERKPWGLDELWIEDPHGIPLCLVEVPPSHPMRRRVE